MRPLLLLLVLTLTACGDSGVEATTTTASNPRPYNEAILDYVCVQGHVYATFGWQVFPIFVGDKPRLCDTN